MLCLLLGSRPARCCGGVLLRTLKPTAAGNMEEAARHLDFSNAGVPLRDIARPQSGPQPVPVAFGKGDTHVVTAATLERIPSFFLYGETARDDHEPTLHIEPIEFRSAPHHWKISPHVHRTLHQVIFVVRGHGVSLAAGATIEYASPALVVVPAGTVHGFDFEPGTEGFVMSIADDLFREISYRDAGVAALFDKSATLELPGEALRGYRPHCGLQNARPRIHARVARTYARTRGIAQGHSRERAASVAPVPRGSPMPLQVATVKS